MSQRHSPFTWPIFKIAPAGLLLDEDFAFTRPWLSWHPHSHSPWALVSVSQRHSLQLRGTFLIGAQFRQCLAKTFAPIRSRLAPSRLPATEEFKRQTNALNTIFKTALDRLFLQDYWWDDDFAFAPRRKALLQSSNLPVTESLLSSTSFWHLDALLRELLGLKLILLGLPSACHNGTLLLPDCRKQLAQFLQAIQ